VVFVPFCLIVYTSDRLTKEIKPGIQGLLYFFSTTFARKSIHSSKYLVIRKMGAKKHEGLQVQSVVLFAFNKKELLANFRKAPKYQFS
jgi:hypothetical protein